MNICWCQPDLAACSALAPHRGTELSPRIDPITSGYLCDSLSKREWACHHICICNRYQINGCWINYDHPVYQKSETSRSRMTCFKPHLNESAWFLTVGITLIPSKQPLKHILSRVEAANEDREDNLEISFSPNSVFLLLLYRYQPLPSLLKLTQMITSCSNCMSICTRTAFSK